ncbi:MAG: DUF2182 domain-containing protein [Pseudomonadota bacterium]
MQTLRLPGGPWPLLPLLSALGWAALGATDSVVALPAYCGSLGSLWGGVDGIGPRGLWLSVAPSQLAMAWLAMLFAMMPMLLLQPVDHLWRRSLARRRWRTIAVFLLGYFAIWAASAPILAAVAAALRTLGDGIAATAAAFALASLWQASPLRQRCLNRCHAFPQLRAFGWRADLDGFRYGVAHGLACFGACWAWMALPLVGDAYHLALMALIGAMLALERQARSRPPVWRLPFAQALVVVRSRLLARHATSRTASAHLAGEPRNA